MWQEREPPGTGVAGLSDSQLLVGTVIRPGFQLGLFSVGLVFNLVAFKYFGVDFVSAFDLRQDDVCSSSKMFLLAITFFGLFASVLGMNSLHQITCLEAGWGTVFIYSVLGLLLLAPVCRGPCKGEQRPFQRALLRCFFPDTSQPIPFREVIVADGLTSLSRCFFDLGFSICALSHSDAAWDEALLSADATSAAKERGAALEECSRSPFPFLLWAIPTLLRARQCIITARLGDAHTRRVQFANFTKYCTMLPVILFAYVHAHGGVQGFPASDFEVFWGLAAVFNTAFAAMWDIVFDWGLLQPGDSKASGVVLRPTLLLRPFVCVYYVAIVLNLGGRTLWTLRWSPSCAQLGSFWCSSVGQSCEVLRRCAWNVLRVEWEVIKNGLHAKQVAGIVLSHPANAPMGGGPLGAGSDVD